MSADSGSLTDIPNVFGFGSSVPKKTNTFLFTFTTHSPQGNASNAPGRPSAKARRAARVFLAEAKLRGMIVAYDDGSLGTTVMVTSPERPLARALVCACVCVCAVLAHSSALAAGFIWLDHAHIEAGLAISRPSAWPELFTVGFAGTGFYRPLMALSLSIDALVAARVAWLYHATNLVWHAAAAWLVVVAAEELGGSRKAATMAGVVFA